MEIDQEPDLNIKKAQMREELRFIHGVDGVFALGFNNHTVFNYEVGAETAFEFDGLVDQRNWFLAFDFQSKLLEFMSQTSFIC